MTSARLFRRLFRCRPPFRGHLALLLAVVCSLFLTILTVTPPIIPTDWARLDADGVYIPQVVDYPWPSYGVQVGLWAGIVAALVYSNPSRRSSLRIQGGSTTRLDWMIILVLLTLLGFGLRVHTLAALPLIVDEIGFAAHASDILHGQHVPIFAPGHNANPSVYSWLVALMMRLFGQNTVAIRLMPLFFGTLSIPAVYALGKAWYSARVGLLAAAFLATYPAHIFFSRMSLYDIVDPVFAMLALAFLANAVRRGHVQHFVLVGGMAACAQYFYHGARLPLLMIVAYVGLSAVSGQLSARYGSSRRKHTFRGLAWMVVTFTLLTMPRFAPTVVGQLPMSGNREALRLPADFFPDNTIRAVLAWFGQPDVSPFWLSDAPLLLLPGLVMFVVGGVYSLNHYRDARYGTLLLSLLLLTMFGGAILTGAPLYVRYITAVPTIALLIAVGLERLARRRMLHILGILIMCIQGIVVAVWQHPAEAQARITPAQWWEHNIARQAAALSQDTSVMLVVPPGFSGLQRITVAHYVAAYGQRRAIAISSGQSQLFGLQMRMLPQRVILLTLNE